LIPAARSLVPAASSRGGMIALTAPAAAPAMTLTAVFFNVLVAPLFLLAARLPPDFVVPVLDPPDRDDDLLRPDFAGILFLPGILAFRLRMPQRHVLRGVDGAILALTPALLTSGAFRGMFAGMMLATAAWSASHPVSGASCVAETGRTSGPAQAPVLVLRELPRAPTVCERPDDGTTRPPQAETGQNRRRRGPCRPCLPCRDGPAERRDDADDERDSFTGPAADRRRNVVRTHTRRLPT
jgi:hypothetical protein